MVTKHLWAITASFCGALAFDASFLDPSLRQAIAASPLKIQLHNSGTVGHVKAIITNTGDVDTYFSAHDNPLSTAELERKVHVFNDANEPALFTGDSSHSAIDGVTSKYERIPARANITREIEIASKFDMAAGEKYFIQTGGFVTYYTEASKDLSTAPYESNALPYEPVTSSRIVLPALPETQSRYVDGSCDDAALKSVIQKSIPLAIRMAQKAADAVAAGENKRAFVAYFKNDSPKNRQAVAGRFTSMVKTLSQKGGPIRFSCSSGTAACQRNPYIAWTVFESGAIVYCAPLKRFKTTQPTCDSNTVPGVIIHELSHASPVFRPHTADIAFPPQQAKALSESRALINAQTFNLFAQSVWLDTVC